LGLSTWISINHVTSVAAPLVAGALLPTVQYAGIFWGTAGLILISVAFALALKAGASRVPHPKAIGTE
jgi:hypothetical protein